MNTREVAVVAVVVLLGVAGAALPTVAATTTDAALQADETNESAPATNATANESDNGSAGFGVQMTAFMQSSAAETNDTVDSGMWTAGFERANESKRAEMARDRTDALDRRIERLRERNRTLADQYDNGSISRSEYVARASELSGRVAALRTSIDETDEAADDAGVNETRLDTLRRDARNMSGPETAGVARNVVAGSQGPPDERGPVPEAVPGNGVGVGPGNETGNASAGNGQRGGPPDSANASTGAGVGGNGNPVDGGPDTNSNDDDPGNAGGGENGPSDGAIPGNGNPGGGDGEPEGVGGDTEDGASDETEPGNSQANPGQSQAGDASDGDESDDSDGDGASGDGGAEDGEEGDGESSDGDDGESDNGNDNAGNGNAGNDDNPGKGNGNNANAWLGALV